MLKRFGVWLLVTIFSVCVLGAAVSTATNSVFGSSDALKDSLAGSGVYDSAADGLVDQAVKSMQRPPEGGDRQSDDLQLDPKTTEKIARKVITPNRLQEYAEEIVDGTYNWLEGEVEQPDYNLDVGALKKDLGDAVGDTAVERVEGLPACTLAQLQKLNTAEINPFTLPCRPPGLNLQAERAKIVKEITASKELLEDTKVTAEDTKTEGENRTLFDNLAPVPALFQWSRKLPWILGVLGIAAGVGSVYLNQDRRKGLKKIAIILLVNGVLLLIGIWLATVLFGSIKFDGTPDDQMRETLVGLVRTLNAAFNRTLLIFAVTYAALGAGGLIWLRVTRPKPPSSESDKPDFSEEKNTGEKEQAPGPKTGSSTSSKK